MKLPEYRIGQIVKFKRSTDDKHLFGTIKMFNISVANNSTNVYYLVDIKEKQVVVREEEISKILTTQPTPVYSIGDQIIFEYFDKDNKKQRDIGTIDGVEIQIAKSGYAIYYTTEEDPNYCIDEEDIIDIITDIPGDSYGG